MKTTEEITTAIKAIKPRGAWARARQTYALELLADVEGEFTPSKLLNGSESWQAFSEGGCALIYDEEIAERVCCPSEFINRRQGRISPNPMENWIQCQTRCLKEAANLIVRLA